MYATRHSNCIDQRAYRAAKASLRNLEDDGVISVQLLQANIFMTLFEVGHALYPTGYLTAGHCARLGQALGLHDRRHAPQLFPLERKLASLSNHFTVLLQIQPLTSQM